MTKNFESTEAELGGKKEQEPEQQQGEAREIKRPNGKIIENPYYEKMDIQSGAATLNLEIPPPSKKRIGENSYVYDYNVDIELIDPFFLPDQGGGQGLAFKDLLPKSKPWHFIRNKKGFSNLVFEDYYGKKIRLIIYPHLSEKGDILSLLHEIGHVHIRGLLETQKNEALEQINQSIRSFLNDLSKFCCDQSQFGLVKRVVVEDLEAESHGIFDDEPKNIPVPKDLIERYGHLWGLTERGSWAFALQTIRNYRKQGLDLEPELRTLSDFREIINFCLKTYEQHFRDCYEGSEKGHFLK